MTQPRATLVSLEATPWYHVVSRCVRRAYLCGKDHHSGRDFEHRRGWIVERLEQLAAVFAIDVAAYAVMSNHFHVVLRVDAERALRWDRAEVLRRWTNLFTGPELVQRYRVQPNALGAAEIARVDVWVATYRERLMDLSWFMRMLNESIARQANAEDGVTGRFWEGRFKSQALLDEQAVLTAMAYVDLNPIRAKLAETPETSDYTSVAERIAGLRKKPEGAEGGPEDRAPLMPFDATGRMATAIPFAFDDYLELVDATGRVIREDKRGFIPGETPRLLERLAIDPEQFVATAGRMLRQFGSAIGTPAHITDLCVARQARYLRGMGAARALFERRAA
ncbi:transposase [Thioalkalivibrio sp.]|uniref:transposase n=1 Tax=Thioalkalivibrio sp. TaxID=2093813 RepID=UPI0039750BFC